MFVVVGESQYDAALVLVEDVRPQFDEALGMKGAVFADLVAKGPSSRYQVVEERRVMSGRQWSRTGLVWERGDMFSSTCYRLVFLGGD